MFKKTILFTYLILLSIGCSSEKKTIGITKDISPTVFKEQIKLSKNLQLVDVRTPNEWNEGIIQKALKINVYDKTFEAQITALKKHLPVFVYCRTGGRSKMAMNQLNKFGFKEVYNLQGGITAWQKAGFAIAR